MLRSLVSIRIQVFSLPSRGAFHLSLTVLYSIGHPTFLALDHGRPRFRRNSTCSALLRFRTKTVPCLSPTGLSPSTAGFPNTAQLNMGFVTARVIRNSLPYNPSTPRYATLAGLHVSGLGSNPFAHHYSGHLFDFFSLRLLRCFTSPASPPPRGSLTFVRGVPPFGHPRIFDRLPLPGAFRRSLRPSSLLDTLASPVCPSSFTPQFILAFYFSCQSTQG